VCRNVRRDDDVSRITLFGTRALSNSFGGLRMLTIVLTSFINNFDYPRDGYNNTSGMAEKATANAYERSVTRGDREGSTTGARANKRDIRTMAGPNNSPLFCALVFPNAAPAVRLT